MPEPASHPDVVHLTTVHRSTDNRIFRKECRALHDAQINVHLVAPAKKTEIVDDIQVHALPAQHGRLRRMTLAPLTAYRAVRKLRPEILHIHDPELIPVAILWKLTSGGRVIFDAHEDLAKQISSKPYIPAMMRPVIAAFARGLEHAADRTFDAVVAATPAIARNFRNKRITLVQNFPWLRDFPAAVPYEDAAPRTASYVGGLSIERGCHEMLEATQSVSDEARLTIAGPITPNVDSLIRSTPCISYLGSLPATEVPRIVGEAQIGYVLFHPLPNHLECQPTKLFEYMAAGRPFIASDFAFWRSLFDTYNCGIFVDPLDVKGIRSAAERLFNDPDAAAAMGTRGRQAVESVFNFEVEGTRLTELTRRLLAS